MFCFPVGHQLLLLPPPAVSVQVDAGRRTEESLLVPVGLLSNLSMKHHHHHVPAVSQVLSHRLPGESLLLWSVKRPRSEPVEGERRGGGGCLHESPHVPALGGPEAGYAGRTVGGCEGAGQDGPAVLTVAVLVNVPVLVVVPGRVLAGGHRPPVRGEVDGAEAGLCLWEVVVVGQAVLRLGGGAGGDRREGRQAVGGVGGVWVHQGGRGVGSPLVTVIIVLTLENKRKVNKHLIVLYFTDIN